MVAENAYNVTKDGTLVLRGHPEATHVFCGAGTVLDAERAEKLQAHLDSQEAVRSEEMNAEKQKTDAFDKSLEKQKADEAWAEKVAADEAKAKDLSKETK